MPAVTKFGKRERPGHNSFHEIYNNLRSHLTRRDLMVGLGATAALSALLAGLHYHAIPNFRVGDIASETVRVQQDMAYEDKAATAEEREIARQRTPAVYDHDGALFRQIQNSLAQAFSTGRDFLAEKQVPAKGPFSPALKEAIRKELEPSVGRLLSPNILHLLIDQRFNTLLLGRITHILDSVLRNGIVDDQAWTQFLLDQRKAIMVRDGPNTAERPLTEAYMVRNRAAVREYLQQMRIEFPDLPEHDWVQLLGFLDGLLAPNLLYNPGDTAARREAAGKRVNPVMIYMEQGKTILHRGEEVTPLAVIQLAALRTLQRPKLVIGQFMGFFLFISAFLYGLWRYLVHQKYRRRTIRQQALLSLLVIIIVFIVVRLLTALIDMLGERVAIEAFRGPFQLYYIIPFAAAGILVALLVNINLGFITSTLVSALAGLFHGDIYIAAYILMGSAAGIYGVRQYKDRAAFLRAGLTIGLVNVVSVLIIGLLRQVPMESANSLLSAAYGFLGGILAAALVSLMLPTFESIFKITTDVRLLELSNMNAPLLRRLSVEAPGTYHHSLMVGTLGEAAAEAIGANPLLVRVGAYYHDLGKMLKPEYFTENQAFGVNKHELLSPNMSCLILASHVKDGLELAKEAKLAQDIRDLIPQHHGTRIMTYFYRKALDSMNDKGHEIDEVDFRYPGPKPQTKEAAILMMADSVEAASRTLTGPSSAQVQGMIDRLVDSILADNQFDECDITLREIRLVKESFFKILTGIYHRRLDYPGYDFKAAYDKSEKTPVTNSNSKHAKAI